MGKCKQFRVARTRDARRRVAGYGTEQAGRVDPKHSCAMLRLYHLSSGKQKGFRFNAKE